MTWDCRSIPVHKLDGPSVRLPLLFTFSRFRTEGTGFPVTLHGAISRTFEFYRRLTADWHRFQQTVLTMDGALACLGFVLTFSAFLSLTAWDFAWWALKLRTSRFKHKCQ